MGIILKDWYGKDKTYERDQIWVRDTDGGLVPFTKGTGASVLEPLEVTENGTYTPPEGVDGFSSVEVNVEGAGTSADVRYVTFMSYDGLTEYGKKAVAVGDDCADPIVRGIFDTPTRESDVQYNYTHNGWATMVNGEADANALKVVTEDKAVYATFESIVRYYTVTFYDEDGSTVLTTKSVAYGSIPSYTPTKDAYDFDGWSPELVAVTGDASYTAKWKQKAAFATSSWADIAAICNEGRASEYFSLGDTRDVMLTYDDGTTETVTFEIVDMNLTEDKGYGIDGSTIGQSSIALLATHTLRNAVKYCDSTPSSSSSVLFGTKTTSIGGVLTNYLISLSDYLPTDMCNALKTLNIGPSYFGTNEVKMVMPSSGNILGKRYNYQNASSGTSCPEQRFEVFKNGRTAICKDESGTAVNYWTSSCEATSSSGANRPVYIGTSGAMSVDKYNKQYYVRPLCFI